MKQAQKGYNVHQARLYSITDELVSKKAFINPDEALKHLISNMDDEKHGQLLSRGVMRVLDPLTGGWVVPKSIPNPKALLFDSTSILAEDWKIAFYDMGDCFMGSEVLGTEPSEETMELWMLNKNAFYCVLSGRSEGDADARFVVAKILHNKNFNLQVHGPGPRTIRKGQNPELLYGKAFAQDRKENELLRKRLGLEE